MRMTPSPVIDLNWAVAVAMADGPIQGLALLDRTNLWKVLSDYYLFHAARADLLRRAGRMRDARDAYTQALNLCRNDRERAFLHHRLTEVTQHVAREDL